MTGNVVIYISFLHFPSLCPSTPVRLLFSPRITSKVLKTLFALERFDFVLRFLVKERSKVNRGTDVSNLFSLLLHLLTWFGGPWLLGTAWLRATGWHEQCVIAPACWWCLISWLSYLFGCQSDAVALTSRKAPRFRQLSVSAPSS